MDGAKSDKDTVKVLMQVKTGDQTRFVALSLKKALTPSTPEGGAVSPHRAARPSS